MLLIPVQECLKDTGIGIAKEKLASIFGAFEQADKSTTRRFGGTGLGLTICSLLVNMMSGKIWVESALGQGSSFHFTVALDRGQVQAAAIRPRQSGWESGNGISLPALAISRSILLAEDNNVNHLTEWRFAPLPAICYIRSSHAQRS